MPFGRGDLVAKKSSNTAKTVTLGDIAVVVDTANQTADEFIAVEGDETINNISIDQLTGNSHTNEDVLIVIYLTDFVESFYGELSEGEMNVSKLVKKLLSYDGEKFTTKHESQRSNPTEDETIDMTVKSYPYATSTVESISFDGNQSIKFKTESNEQ